MNLIVTLDVIFMITEIALIICLMIPAIPRKSWKQAFDTTPLRYFCERCHFIFLLMLLILTAPFLSNIYFIR